MKSNLRRLLEERGVTQKQLSNMTGIPEATISRYITGRVESQKYLLLLAIASKLGVQVNDIITED